MRWEMGERKQRKMRKEIMVAVLVLCVVVSQMESVEAEDPDCYDLCSTGCVQPDTRLMQRCDRKCQIKCGPDADPDFEVNLG
ncbi:hypothetical protein FH972_005561 [Carpinus fangiana]|uniref:Uncharacterized protein n=1 Tax=Carpinus fangiana TaxID=176857 RepID=A0A5N6QPN2_9ROSI|nr:hypothetical protein FH972_005561 [Carpinus fangiana]